MQYGVDEKPTMKVTTPLVMKDLPSQTVFTALEGNTISFWLLREDIGINFRQKKIENGSADSLMKSTFKQINEGTVVRCENRSLDRQRSNFSSSRDGVQESVQSLSFSVHSLKPLYDVLVSPIAEFLQGDDLVFVPDGHFCLAPFSALSDSVKIRAIPSLTALKLITIAPDDFQGKNEALLVGDPCLKEVTYRTGEPMYAQLPCAKKEVDMIGELLQTVPLTGKNATKAEVLKRMKSVGLIHIAAHGDAKFGEIALAPNPKRTSQILEKEDYMLSLSDVQAVRLQARLVVLSCCHSGQGEVKSEGIVGIARAFLCAGARSVLVSLWAIDDEATFMFMKSFYQHLADRKSASTALHHAMKSLRETKNYSAIKYWAPFVLIGEDVTFEFGQHEHKKDASSHGNVDDISNDSDIHPVIAVAGDDDDDDEVGDEEGKEEEGGGNKQEEDDEEELEGNEDEVALEAERIDTLGLEHHEQEDKRRIIYEGTVTSEGICLHLKLGAVHLTFPPDAMSEPTPIIVHRWKREARSPPLGEHEAVVSNVIEIYTNTDAEAFEFNNEVRLALSHSGPNLKGYELVIKRLVDAETNEWEDVDGSEDFQCPSGIVDDYSSTNDIPDSCFPVVQADITKCSTYAVVCRLKLSPAYTITVNGGTYSHPDYPDVIIAVPKKAIPNKTKVTFQLKVQEVLQDEFNGLDLCSGPILRILGSPSAEFLRPVTIQLPITYGLDPEYIPDPSVCRVRIFFLTSDGESKEWIEITSDLENPASFDGNFVKFQVRRFSGYTCFVHWCKEEIRSNASGIITYLSSLIWNQPREANFFAYFQPAERLNSQDVLFLICYPVHLREMVKQEHVKEGITSRHVSSKRKMIPGQDKAFVFVSGGMCPVSLKDMDDLYLRFDGDAPFDAHVRVRLISVQEYCQVDFRSTRESTGNNLLSTLYLKWDHQEHSSPEEGGEDLKQTGDRLLEERETPSRERLEWLSRNLTSWKPLARRLSFTEGDIKRFNKNNEEWAEKALSMLLRWKEKKGSEATYAVLRTALRHESVGRTDLAEKVIKPNLKL
ncbi:uncharacterized protein [Montipora capricornis]|uniref:uncharacterized protein n=1 Tax=Montipora capricornis TaxID=246305 RepID=UPI0035F128EE